MKKFLILIGILLGICSETFAYSPFDIVLRNPADISVADVSQDLSSKAMIVRICNVGSEMTQVGNLILGVKRSTGHTITNTIEGVTLAANACRDFSVGSVDGLGIVGTETGYFTAAVKLTKTTTESNLANNKITKYLTVSASNNPTPLYNSNTGNYGYSYYNSPYTNYSYYSTYGTPDFIVSNIRFESSVSAYRGNDITTVYNAYAADICNYGSSITLTQDFQVTFRANNHTEYVTLSPYYSSYYPYNYNYNYYNNYSTYGTWAQSECRTVAIEADKFTSYYTNSNWYPVSVEANSGYNRVTESNTNNNTLQSSVYTNYYGGGNGNYWGNPDVHVISPNGGETYGYGSSELTIRGEITNYYQNVDWMDVEIYRSGYNWNDTPYKTERLSNLSWYTGNSTLQINRIFSISSWPSDNYRVRLVAHTTSGNTFYDWSDSTFRISGQSQADLTVQSISQAYNESQIIARICNNGGGMTDSRSLAIEWYNSNNNQYSTQYVWIRLTAGQCINTSISPGILNIYQNGYYTIRVTADSNNDLSESNRSNNSLTQTPYIRVSY